MIELIPATDIIDGRLVRLTQGNYDTKKDYGDPIAQAKELEQMGFRRLHVVDLDGAKSKHVVNLATLRAITRETSLVVDFGGGVKTDDDLERAFEAGATMVTAGSIAATDPERVWQWAETYGPERLILGADARDGRISINGWLSDAGADLHDFLAQHLARGMRNVLCTDISRDGMLQGPSFELYDTILQRHPEAYLIASGGVASIEDIRELERRKVPAVVFVKAIYEGRINLNELTECFLKE